MSSYVSNWTGRQIDNAVGTISGSGLENVVGIIRRDSNGYYFAAERYTPTQGGTTLSLVDTGDMYKWDHMIPMSLKGASSGVAELDSNGKVPSGQLPAYVDDVLEFDSESAFPATGETGKIYVTLDTNLTYRWSGSTYVEISQSLALGETDSTAFRGDWGKVAYNHASANPKGSAFSTGLYKITTNAEGHVTGAIAVQKSDITDLGIPAQDTTYSFSDKDVTLSTWGGRYTIATVGGTDIHITMPSNPNTNTTYTFEGGTNKFMVTPSGGSAQTVTVTPSITNNITGSGTSGSLAKFNGANTVTDGPALGSDTTKYLRNDGQWIAPPNTEYESKSAASGGTAVSLVTTGEKYIWNNKLGPSDKGVANGVAPLGANGLISTDYLPTLTNVSVSQILTTGVSIAKITVNGTETTLYAPSSGSGGSTVSVNQVVTSGTKIATITVDSIPTDLFVPSIGVNSKTTDGVVSAPTASNTNKMWGTDGEGNPGWRTVPSTGITSIATGDGLSGGPITSTGTLKADLLSYTKLSAAAPSTTTTTNRTYPVVLDSAGHLSVNIPWENTTYENKTASSGGTDVSLVTTGDKYTWNSKVEAISISKVTTSGTKSATVTVDGTTTDLYYDTNLRAGAVNGSTSSTTTSGNTYLNLTENGTFKSGIHLIPGLNMSVTSNAEGSITFAAQNKIELIELTLTLNANQWVSGSQTVTATGVTSSNSVVVSAAPGSVSGYVSNGVKCTAQGTNTLTFECVNVPTVNLQVNVLVLEEETL